MRVLALTNQKGGVGKTTSTGAIGSALAAKGFKTLLIDLDPQANLTGDLGIDEPSHTITDILFKSAPLLPHEITTNLYLIAGCSRTAAFESNARDLYNDADIFFILKEYFDAQRLDYDFILIDCPPAIGTLIANAYIMATELLVPLEIDKNALAGLQMVQATADRLQKRFNLPPRKISVFFTKYEKHTLIGRLFTSQMQENYGEMLLEAKIRHNGAAIKEAALNCENLLTYAPDSNGAKDYWQLADELLNN